MSPMPKVVWIKKQWNLKQNPFPAEAIARLGSSDLRENGLLFNPAVQPDKVAEAIDKFVIGAAYSGQKFGFLWSLGTGLHGDARGFGKSVLLQYLVEHINTDFGKAAFLQAGLDASDADENPMCAVLASFDMANARSLNAVFFEAARYACRFVAHEGELTLAERIRERLVANLKSEEPEELFAAVQRVQLELRGRTLGPPVPEFLELLCGADSAALKTYMDGVKPGTRTRSGASYLATFLLIVKAAGIDHVLLCCDQLEDFAATTTTKQKRSIETERFRDYILELQPMGDMLSCVVTMHPRATQAIGDMWRLADLPSYEYDRHENRHRIVIMEPLKSAEDAATLIQQYLGPFRITPSAESGSLHPFSEEAIEAIFVRSDGKPRDILRKANALIDAGAEENWDLIDGDRAALLLDSFRSADDDDYWAAAANVVPATANRADLWDT
jgi:hypothetical protein